MAELLSRSQAAANAAAVAEALGPLLLQPASADAVNTGPQAPASSRAFHRTWLTVARVTSG
jgi:hypothetical protein